MRTTAVACHLIGELSAQDHGQRSTSVNPGVQMRTFQGVLGTEDFDLHRRRDAYKRSGAAPRELLSVLTECAGLGRALPGLHLFDVIGVWRDRGSGATTTG